MNVKQALIARKSVRAYLDKPVSEETLTAILDAARYSPSGANVQPWQVAVVSGETKRELVQTLEQQYRSNEKAAMDYQYYPLEWGEPYKQRRIACGQQLYSALNIQRDDKQRRTEQWVANYRGFDAPVILFFFMDGRMQKGSYLDCGMFIQSVMLAAVEEGLATCPQAALAEYPAVVKSALGYADSSILICGMAVGYEDNTAAINNYRTPRAEVSEFVRFYK